MHGFAFNINTDLSLFLGIIPCGISDKEVTSLSKELGERIEINEVKSLLVKNFKEVFGYDLLTTLSKEELFHYNFPNS